jgi:hypothetical protein
MPAQSLFQDHAPAKQFGLATAWTDHRPEQAGWGAKRGVTSWRIVSFIQTIVGAHEKEALRS